MGKKIVVNTRIVDCDSGYCVWWQSSFSARWMCDSWLRTGDEG